MIEIDTPLERTTAAASRARRQPSARSCAPASACSTACSLIPVARVSFIGLYRNEETLEPVEYYIKLPDDLPERDVILLDPMLATGSAPPPPRLPPSRPRELRRSA